MRQVCSLCRRKIRFVSAIGSYEATILQVRNVEDVTITIMALLIIVAIGDLYDKKGIIIFGVKGM